MLKPLVKTALRALARLLFRVRREGDRGALATERLVIIANHESFLDGLLLGLFLPIDPLLVVHSGVAGNPLFVPCWCWSTTSPSIRPARWR